jgi:hypothetical protein
MMYREVVYLSFLLVLYLGFISSAAISSSSSRGRSDNGGTLSIDWTEDQEDTALIGRTKRDAESTLDRIETHRRTKRHAAHAHGQDETLNQLIAEIGGDSSVISRSRRSAVFMLHAAIKLCQSQRTKFNRYQCAGINLNFNDVNLNVSLKSRIADE